MAICGRSSASAPRTSPQYPKMALSSGTGTGVFFLFAIGLVAFLIIWWAMATYAKQKRQRLAAANEPSSIPHPHDPRSRFGNDPVVRAEAGENTDGLPKYSARARGDEQTVDRNAAVVEMGRVGGFRPTWMGRPSMFGQATLPTQPPPAYDPTAPRAL
ncbi:hypothetical protein FRC10_007097 [Ceratobasidium sp. 414]|nr:hypothetical protein FRC10_007097 [Ceratobasidium sp. 414]